MKNNIIKKNLVYSSLNYIVINILRFLVRLVFIRVLSIEYLGVNGLFSNILAVLSLAELGVGPAIVYSLYKPLALGDKETTKAIMQLYKKLYIAIGIVVLILGLLLFPWLDWFIKDKQTTIEGVKYFYLVFLLNTSVSYFWSYKRSLLIADQKQYLVNIIQVFVQISVSILQIALLYFSKTYWSYLLTMLIGTILENLVTARKADNEYPYLRERAQKVSDDIRHQIIRNTGAMIGHKIGGIIVFSSSNLIISKLVGLASVGMYSIYYMVINAMNSIATKFFETITSSIGHMVITESQEHQLRAFKIIQFITAIQASFISVGLYALFNTFIELWVGKDYLFDDNTVLYIVVSFYLMYMRKTVLMFRDACGLYWYDRYKPLAEALINIVASVYLAIRYGTVGVVYGGIISTLLTCFWVEPYILFKYGIRYDLKKYYFEYFQFVIVTFFCGVSFKYFCSNIINSSSLISFFICMILVVAYSSIIWSVVFFKRDEYRFTVNTIKNIFQKHFTK